MNLRIIRILFFGALSCCFLSGCALAKIQELPFTRATDLEITHAGSRESLVRIDYTYDGGAGTSCFDGRNVPEKIFADDVSSACPVGFVSEPLLVVSGFGEPTGFDASSTAYLRQYHPGDSYIDYSDGKQRQQFALYRRRWWGYPAMVLLAPGALVVDTAIAIVAVPVGVVLLGGSTVVLYWIFASDDNWWHV